MLIRKVPLQIKPPSNIVFVVTNEYLDLNAYIIKMGFPYPDHIDKDSVELEGYVYSDQQGRDYYCVIHRFTSSGYIAHEIRHLLNHVYHDINYTPDLDNDELDCYLLGYFVDYLQKLQLQYAASTAKNTEDEDVSA